eukprot:3114604-Pleurochrysis_carterae.AAC.2
MPRDSCQLTTAETLVRVSNHALGEQKAENPMLLSSKLRNVCEDYRKSDAGSAPARSTNSPFDGWKQKVAGASSQT